MAMASSRGLLGECVQQLKASAHDYEKLLGTCLEGVWRAISISIERQLRLRKGVSVQPLGKFAFVRDLQPLTPVFQLSDRFVSAYGVIWRRPPPALLSPAAEMNMSVVGAEAGGIPKDQVVKALDALLAFLGRKLQKGAASGMLRLGNVGVFLLDGKSATFQYDTTFTKSITTSARPDATPFHSSGAKEQSLFYPTGSSQEPKSVLTVPRSVSLQALAAADTPKILIDKEEYSRIKNTHSNDNGDRHHHRRDRRHKRHPTEPDEDTTGKLGEAHRHTNSTSVLPSSTPTQPIDADAESNGQILPRFMLPDPLRSPSTVLYTKHATALQRTFEFKREELLHKQAQQARQDDEIDRRTNATRLRCVQERAEKTVSQRDLDAFLNMQIELKHSEKRRLDALDAASTNFDAVRVLPRDPVVTREQRQAAKNKLRGRLHDQVTLKDTLAKQRLAVDRAESAYFMVKVREQGEREHQQRDELRRLAREALTADWRQQRAFRDECEQMRVTRG